MRVSELLESKVQYTVKHGTRKFRVSSDVEVPFKELQHRDEVKKYLGPNTTMIDVTKIERVQKAPAIFGQEEDQMHLGC